MQVTLAQVEDASAIAEVHVSSWQAAYSGLFPPEYLASLSVGERAAGWQRILATAGSRTFVARRGGAVVGFVSFGPCRDPDSPRGRGEVWALYVAPEAWSTGAGWALWETARVQLLHAGYTEVSLWVLSRNARGLRFYEAAGFRREPGTEQTLERGGATLQEVRLLFALMSANPSIERTPDSTPRYTASSLSVPRGVLSGAAHVER
ncbi:MAG: GNAT family N-acetyltransferase [Rudaea sp.]|uniref:GNAT family N-acetyltransferase n=1 Tax=Rudaea sp. TaxID=2136325 RepID=UPI0039E5DE57